MCGFVGYIGSQPIVSRQRLTYMRDTLTHRGPDDAGLWVGTSSRAAIGLAHRRLSILDTRLLGRQPMATSTGDLTIAYNGEFYGFKQARQTLISQGQSFSTMTDTEVILGLYKAHGLDFLDHLDGMFAFALWDRKTEYQFQ